MVLKKSEKLLDFFLYVFNYFNGIYWFYTNNGRSSLKTLESVANADYNTKYKGMLIYHNILQ